MMENEPIPNTTETYCPNCGSKEVHPTLPFPIVDASEATFAVVCLRCSMCDETFLVPVEPTARSEQEADEITFPSPDLNPGDVLRLPIALGEIPAGLYMVRTVGFLIEMARCAENEDGDLASTHRIIKVTHHEIERFEPTYLTIPTALDHLWKSD